MDAFCQHYFEESLLPTILTIRCIDYKKVLPNNKLANTLAESVILGEAWFVMGIGLLMVTVAATVWFSLHRWLTLEPGWFPFSIG
jgi:hypothetical protein